jgi:folate-binding protein YgfZ
MANGALPHPDPQAWAALGHAAVAVELDDVGALRLTGPDRVDFLNGQVAHDVRALSDGHALRALYLDVKGHALDELRVHRRDRDLHVAVEDGRAAAVLARLTAHRVFDDVTLEDLGTVLACVTVQGPTAGEVVRRALGQDPPEDGTRFAQVPFASAEVLVARHRRSEPGGIDLHLLRRDLSELRAALQAAGAVAGDRAGLEASRVAAGLARAAVDAGPGVLPQEAGLGDAISTRKGCYLGQETMARIEARATLRRGLARLRLDGWPGEEARPPLRLDGREVGRLGSVAVHPELGPIALAVLRRDLPGDATLEAGSASAAILTT